MKRIIRKVSLTTAILGICMTGIASAQLTSTPGNSGGALITTPDDPTGLAAPLDPRALGSVLDVSIEFANGAWRQVGEPEVIHCRPPRNLPSSSYSSEIRLVDGNGKLVSSRSIPNPRVVLPEDPRSKWDALKNTQVQLQIEIPHLAPAPQKIEFFETDRQDGPSVVIDLAATLDNFNRYGGKRIPNCELGDPPLVRIGDSAVYVPSYTLNRAAQAAGLTGQDMLIALEKYSNSLGNHVRIPEAALDLLLSSRQAYRKY
ncbi:MAG: hypothetical protein OSB70_13160 [Myxococcota bacterium]|nr:hypothetical protein [Myxococcota bacterium]